MKASSKETDVFPIAKLFVVGDEGVGKTSLIRRYCTGDFKLKRESTNAVDVQAKIAEVNGLAITLSIWDVVNKGHFDILRYSFLRSAQAVALVYDVTATPSLDSLSEWHRQILKATSKASFCVVGNKADLPRVVPREHAETWASQHGFPHVEASAKTSKGVDDLFTTLARLAARLV